MTIKAPMATPLRTCDAHQARAWVMGDIAVYKNAEALALMAEPAHRDQVLRRPIRGQTVIKPATDEWLEEQKARMEHLRATAALKTLQYELADVQREQAELERAQSLAIAGGPPPHSEAEVRAETIKQLKQLGQARIGGFRTSDRRRRFDG